MLSQCPSCKKQIDVPEAALVKKVRCSGCQAVFVVALPTQEEVTDLEGLADEASLPKKKAVAPTKNPAPPPKKKQPGSSLDFGDTDPVSDFSFVASTKKPGYAVKLRAAGAAAFLRYSAFYAFIPTLFQ